MDPTTALRDIRMFTENAEYCTEDEAVEAFGKLAEMVGNLDEWMVKGGFLPEQWTVNR